MSKQSERAMRIAFAGYLAENAFDDVRAPNTEDILQLLDGLDVTNEAIEKYLIGAWKIPAD